MSGTSGLGSLCKWHMRDQGEDRPHSRKQKAEQKTEKQFKQNKGTGVVLGEGTWPICGTPARISGPLWLT